MIDSFSCNNFRNITADKLEFEKINILIGPNNSGKSNFIKALGFFAEMLNKSGEGNLKSAFLNAIARNGWDHILNKKADATDVIDLSWRFHLDGEPVVYRFSFGVGAMVEDCNIVLEELYSENGNQFRCHDVRQPGEGFFSSALPGDHESKGVQFLLSNKEPLVIQFEDVLLKNGQLYTNPLMRENGRFLLNNMRSYFSKYNTYASAGLNSRKIREPGDVKNMDTQLKYDASNFVNVFNHYKSSDILWKNLFEERFRELVPSLQAVDTVAVYDKLIFKLVYDGGQYDLSDVSEGTLKGLILNMLINMPMEFKHSLLAIDEPETNLHPAWQKVVGNWIQTADTFDQCFISTHSPDFLDVFTENFKTGNVAVFVFEDNTTIKKIKYPDIADEMGDWELGDLYRTNDPALGGWPW